MRLSRLAGLQICGILLANNFSLYNGDNGNLGGVTGGITEGVTSVQCFEKLFVCLGSRLKDVYSATGEGFLFLSFLLFICLFLYIFYLFFFLVHFCLVCVVGCIF